MTLNDPLIKDLKGRIRSLIESASSSIPFGDNDEVVISLCLSLEHIFAKGLLRREGFTPWRVDPFQWFFQLVRKYHRILPLSFKIAFDEVLNCSKVKTPLGKFRLLLRICLKRRCLFVPIQLHVDNEDWNDITCRVYYDPLASILGHDILSQIFLTLVQQLSSYNFGLDLSNSAFLDEAWQLGSRVSVEVVPCIKLGMTLGFPLGFPLVVDILENSCAAEIQPLIGVGDILEELNGTFLRHVHGAKLDSLFRKIRSAPFQITFIKGVNPQSGQVYLPVIKLYRILGLDPEIIASVVKAKTPDEEKRDQSLVASGEKCVENETLSLGDLVDLSGASLVTEAQGTIAASVMITPLPTPDDNSSSPAIVNLDEICSTNFFASNSAAFGSCRENENTRGINEIQTMANDSSESALNLQESWTDDSERLIVF